MLGLTKREITRRFDEIVEFAEMKDFIDAPVKTYSSGMYMRLGFAVAIHVDPDVLLVDEVLAVGDEGFTHKCLDKFAEFKRRGKTILLVTHSLGLVERFCDEALWLDAGRMKGIGRSQAHRRRLHHRRRASAKNSELAAGDAKAQESAIGACRPTSPRRPSCPIIRSRPPTGPADMFRATEGRWGSRESRDHRRPARAAPTARRAMCFTPASRSTSGSRLRVAAARSTISSSASGIFNAEGVCCYGTNTSIEELTGRAHGRRRRSASSRSRPSTSSKAPTSSTSPIHKLDGYPVRLSPAALHLPREVAHEGRRHLSAAPRLALLRQADVRAARKTPMTGSMRSTLLRRR